MGRKRTSERRPRRPRPAGKPARGPDLWILLLLAALTLAAFWQVLGHSFVQYDDNTYVLENRQVRGGLTSAGLRWALTTGHAANWHPLTWLSHMLDVELFGMDPRGHHAVSLLFHLANTLLLYLALGRMTGRPWPSAFVAALFAVHPLHVESVAWVAERKDVLSTLFWMLCLLAWMGWVRRGGAGRYALLVALFALGLMAKPMLVTLPFVLLLLDWWPLGRFAGGPSAAIAATRAQGTGGGVPAAGAARTAAAEGRTGRGAAGAAGRGSRTTGEEPGGPQTPDAGPGKAGRGDPRSPGATARATKTGLPGVRGLVLEKLPLFAIAAASSVITLLVQREGGAMKFFERLPFGLRLENAFLACLRYIGKMLWPANLAVLYPHPGKELPIWGPLAAALSLAAASWLVLRQARRRPYLAVGWLWYLGTLVPVLGLVQVGGQALADRYTYVPLIGLFLLLAWGAAEWAAAGGQATSGATGLAATGSGGGIARRIRTATLAQAGAGSPARGESESSSRGPRESPSSGGRAAAAAWGAGGNGPADGHRRRAAILAVAGASIVALLAVLTAMQVRHWADSTALFEHALLVTRDNPTMHYGLGAVLLEKGDVSGAVAHLEQAVALAPADIPARCNLGNALASQGRTAEALEHYRLALERKPDYAPALYNLGITLLREERVEEAADELEKLLQVETDNADALHVAGRACLQAGRTEKAGECFARALALQPGHGPALRDLGVVLALQGRGGPAAEHLQRALQANPGDFEAWYQLGNLGLQAGRDEEARECFQRSLGLRPDFLPARHGLGQAFERLGRYEEATAQYKEILHANPRDAGAQEGLTRLEHAAGAQAATPPPGQAAGENLPAAAPAASP